jgi:hypothetical protein
MKAGYDRGRQLAALAICAILSACAGHDKPPTTVADACRMQSERPQWFAAMRKTEDKWGVPVSVQLATIGRESSFRHVARPTRRIGSGLCSREVPRSSAYGYAQALDGTWDDYRRATGRHRADRDDFSDASDFIGWYMNGANRVNGVALHDTYNQYLAYHEGKAGFARGTYRSKSWLPPVARDVEAWAALYDKQLQSCPVRRR